MATQEVAATRKRRKESASSSQSDVPNAKKKKMGTKGKEAALPAVHSSSALPTSPPLLPATTTAPTVGATGPSSQSVSEVTVASASPAPKKKSPKLPKNKYLQPQRLSPGSWMTHIASLVVHRCAQQAESRGLDPRGHLSEINWSQMLDGLLGPEDLQMMWYFIRREYPQHTLTAILDATQPYSDLTLDKLIQEEIRLKYKDTIPKPPLTPYMMFMKTKQPKLKRKYPDLPMTEVATKIGKKWSAMAEEKKEKYKQQYVALKAAYDTQLKTFYEEHPDAKPPPKQPASRSKKLAKNTAHAVGDTEEEKRIRALKAELPKLPLSAYLHFCKKKREKLHRKYPDLPPNAVTVKLGKRWQTMDEEARSKYVKLHQASVLQYKENMAIFNREHPEAQELLAKARKTRRKQKVPAKQPSRVAKELVISPPLTVTSPPHTLSTSQPTPPEGQGFGGEEEETAPEVLPSTLSQQNGGTVEGESSDNDSSDSESDSSESSTED